MSRNEIDVWRFWRIDPLCTVFIYIYVYVYTLAMRLHICIRKYIYVMRRFVYATWLTPQFVFIWMPRTQEKLILFPCQTVDYNNLNLTIL